MATTTIDELQVLITAQTKEFNKQIGHVQDELQEVGKQSGKLSKTSAAAFGIIAGAAQALVNKGINLITSSIGSAAKRVDTLKNSDRVFKNMGFSAKDTKTAMNDLNVAITGLPTALDDAVSGVQALASVSGDLKDSQRTYKALNDGILAFGGSAEMVKGAVLQLSQLPMDGPLDAQTWNSLRNNGLTPVFAAMAKDGHMSISDLKKDFGDGTLTVQDFTDSLQKLDRDGGGGMASLEKQARDATDGIQTGWANMQTAITRGVAKVLTAVGGSNISGVLAGIGKAFERGLAGVADGIDNVQNYIGNLAKMDPDKAAAKIGTALGKALAKAFDKLRVTSGQINKWFSKVDWANLGLKIGKQAVNFAVGFIGGLATADWDGAFKILQKNWLPILVGVLSIMFSPAKFGKPIAKLLTKIPFGNIFLKAIVAPLRNIAEPIRIAFSTVFGAGQGVVSSFLSRIGAMFSVIPKILTAPFRIAIDAIAQEILKIPAFVNGAMTVMKASISGTLNLVKAIFVNTFNAIFTAVKTIFSPFVEFFKGMFAAIGKQLTGVPSLFTAPFRMAWSGVKLIWEVSSKFFSGIWASIKNIFSGTASWFTNIFRGAYSGITGVFSKLGSFFSNIWSKIVGIFRNVGTSVGNAIGGSFKGVINSVLSGASRVINGFINTINSLKNKIPVIGNKIPSIPNLNVPRLAAGGIVTGPTLAEIGEGGQPEAVIPLDKLESMLGGRGTPVNVQIDGKTLLSFVIDGINNKSFMSNSTAIEL